MRTSLIIALGLGTLGSLGCDDGGRRAPDASTPADGGAIDAAAVQDADSAPDADGSDAGGGTGCLDGLTLDLTGSPPHVWICTVPEEDRATVCPTRTVTDATECGPLGGMLGFYRAATYELRTYGIVSISHGTIMFDNVTGIPEGEVIEAYFTDSRHLWFRYSGEQVTLMGYTMTPP